jgi:hypothetical protein
MLYGRYAAAGRQTLELLPDFLKRALDGRKALRPYVG